MVCLIRSLLLPFFGRRSWWLRLHLPSHHIHFVVWATKGSQTPLSLVSKLPFTIWKPEPAFTLANNLVCGFQRKNNNNKKNTTLRPLVFWWDIYCVTIHVPRTPCDLRPKLHSCCHNLPSHPSHKPPYPRPPHLSLLPSLSHIVHLLKHQNRESLCQDLFLRNPT